MSRDTFFWPKLEWTTNHHIAHLLTIPLQDFHQFFRRWRCTFLQDHDVDILRCSEFYQMVDMNWSGTDVAGEHSEGRLILT